MSTHRNSSNLQKVLGNVSVDFRSKIIDVYLRLKDIYSLSQYNLEYDNAGLLIGKYVETLIRFIQKEVKGSFTPFGTSIPDMARECRSIIETKIPVFLNLYV
jgi:hypothetical protein